MQPDGTLTPLQRSSLIGGLALVGVLSLAIALRVDEQILKWLKSFSSLAPFAVALVAGKRLARLGWVVLALGLSAFGDLLLTGCLPVDAGLARLAGMAVFLAAYLALTAAFWGPVLRTELTRLIPYAAVGVVLLGVLWGSLPGIMRVGVPVFMGVAVTMAWTLGLAPRRRVLRRQVAVWAAAAGIVLLASDAGVAFAMFTPPSGAASVWLDAYIRATYLVGWVLLLLVAVDPAPARLIGQGRRSPSETPTPAGGRRLTPASANPSELP